MATSDGSPVSVRLPAELLQALRERAESDGMTMSDALRIGALLLLGICPTCGQKAPGAGKDAATEGGGVEP